MYLHTYMHAYVRPSDRSPFSDSPWDSSVGAENMDHEVAWNWLWENVERIISQLGKCGMIVPTDEYVEGWLNHHITWG